MDASPFRPFAARMRAQGLPEIFIASFARYYEQLRDGITGLIPERDIVSVARLPDADALPGGAADVGRRALGRTVVIKLNGGLGTSMGLEQAKSLLEVKDGHTFLDVIARQALHDGVPLLLMNSFATDADSLAAMGAYPALAGDLPLSFVQHKQPKIAVADLTPAEWPANPALEWCPPGHGDLYTALVTSGTLTALRQAGHRYAFVSNSDNLGAVLDPAILGHFVQSGSPFLMEVADRTEMDRKGGHLARTADGRLLLRESAQCPADDMDAFQDISRHRFFNTNNLWLDLEALEAVLQAREGWLGLDMIRNAKNVDPRDPGSTPVYQLETAMGSAISVFEGAQALRVPRSRFAPVKRPADLLAVRSDAYVLRDDFRVAPNPARRGGPLVVDLDARHYAFASDIDDRFPAGPPSCVACDSLTVDGPFTFGAGVRCIGNVTLVNTGSAMVPVPDGEVLEGERRF